MIVNAEATDEELFDHEMRAEGEQADRDERTKHIQVKYEHGHGSDELARDHLREKCTHATRIVIDGVVRPRIRTCTHLTFIPF